MQQCQAKVGSKRRATRPGHVPADTHVVRSTQETRTACPVLALQRSRAPRNDAATLSQGRLKATRDAPRSCARRHACCPQCSGDVHSVPCAGTAKKPSPEERRSNAEPRSAQSNARCTPVMCPQTRMLSAVLRRRAQRALCWHCKEVEPQGMTQQRRAKVGSKRRVTHPGHVPADTHVVRSTQETRTACPVLALQRSRVPRSNAAPPSQGRLKAVCSGLEHGDFL